MNAMIKVTDAAAARIAALMAKQAPAPEALMISVKTKGCSGLSYDLQYLTKKEDAPPYADKIEVGGVTVFVDPRAGLYLTGSTMDYREDGLKSGFEFINPNETGRCGCGESFTVDK